MRGASLSILAAALAVPYDAVVLDLPLAPVCRDDCPGLCPQCGANRNDTACECAEDVGDLRLSVLRTLKVSR